MTKKEYDERLNLVIEVINDGVSLMTSLEELTYKKMIVDNITDWVKDLELTLTCSKCGKVACDKSYGKDEYDIDRAYYKCTHCGHEEEI